jgi:ATP-dependent Clp protease ATP-binding subunit ClpA
MISRVENAAWEQAKRLSHHWVGPEHVLLSILLGPEDELAVRALRASGLRVEIVEQQLEEMNTAGPRTEKPEEEGSSSNPYFQQVLGRAEGFAASFGAQEPEAVHFLLAMLWDTRFWQLAEGQGVRRAGVIAELRRLGATLPAAPPPLLERVLAMTQNVEFPRDRLDDVVRLLLERHPPTKDGPIWGFNYVGADLAVVSAEDGIDLDAIVAEASGR